jgi:large subunit ribosomal protein L19e
MYICPDTDDSAHLNAARKEVKLEEKKNPMIEDNGGSLQVHPGNASGRILPLQTQTSAHTEGKGEGEGALQENKETARSATEAADAAEAASDTASRCAAECEAAHLAAKECASPASTSAAPPTAAARAAAAAVYAAAAANAAMRAAAAAAEAAKAAAEAAASEALVQDAQKMSVERPLVFRDHAVSRKRLCDAYSRSTDEGNIPILLKNMWENQGINATRVSAVFVLVCMSTLCMAFFLIFF